MQDKDLSESYRKALEAVAELYKLNITLAPQKPTREMLLSGADSGHTSIKNAYGIYQAMLSAYNDQPQEVLLESKKSLEAEILIEIDQSEEDNS